MYNGDKRTGTCCDHIIACIRSFIEQFHEKLEGIGIRAGV